MADFFLHTQLIEDIYQKNPEYKLLGYAKIGAQGPDPFYYVLKSKYQKESMNLADDMHDSKINEFLIAITDYVKAHQTDILLAYYKGFLTHFVLDVNIHPYIYYYTGEYFVDRPKTYKFRGYHLRFERSVDIAYIRNRYHQEARMFHKRSRILPIKDTPSEIRELHQKVASLVYGVHKGSEYFDNGYQSMRKLLKLLISDKTGFKKLLLSILDLFNRSSPIYLLLYRRILCR